MILINKYPELKRWSGGTTQEFFIWPTNSLFADKSFDYRISQATIEIASSEFTPLSGYHRTLMLLKGELKLIHKNHHENFLMPGSVDFFEGGWESNSVGIATDFNIIHKPHISIEAYQIKDDYSFKPQCSHIFIYCYEGNGSINQNEINEGESAFIDCSIDSTDVSLIGCENWVIVEISF